MLSFFRSNNPGVVVFYLVYLVGFRLFFAFNSIDTTYVFEHNEPLSVLLFTWLRSLPISYNVVGSVLSGALCFIQALFINGIINENKMTARKNYLGGLIFILYASFFKESLLLSPAAIAFTFLIIATGKIFALTRKEKSYGEIFDIGFLVALASLFYFPAILFIIFAYVGLTTVRTFSYREWVAILVGFIAPFIPVFTYYYFTDTRPGPFVSLKVLSSYSASIYDWVQIAALLACTFAAFLLLPGFLYSSLIQVRKFTTLLIVALFFSALTFFLQQKPGLSHLVFFSLPAGVITAMILLQIKNKIIPEVIHLILILLVLGGQFLPLLKLF